MKPHFSLLWLIPVLARLYPIARLGSVGFAIGVVGFIGAVGLFMFATRKRPSRDLDERRQ